MSPFSPNKSSMFWNEEAQQYELHMDGYVLHGPERDVRAVFEELNRMCHTSAELRLHILEIDRTVSAAMARGVRP